MKATPWADEKLVARSPVIDMPAVTPAAACSLSGSMKISGLSEMLRWPLALLRPVFAHLRGRRDGVGAGGVGRLTLDVNDSGVAVHRVADAGILDLVGGNSDAGLRHEAGGEDLLDHRECHGSFLGFRVQVCNGSGSLRRIFFAAAPFTARSVVSNQTMAPVGQRSMGSRVAWSFQS
jgi:hypothetical protein